MIHASTISPNHSGQTVKSQNRDKVGHPPANARMNLPGGGCVLQRTCGRGEEVSGPVDDGRPDNVCRGPWPAAGHAPPAAVRRQLFAVGETADWAAARAETPWASVLRRELDVFATVRADFVVVTARAVRNARIVRRAETRPEEMDVAEQRAVALAIDQAKRGLHPVVTGSPRLVKLMLDQLLARADGYELGVTMVLDSSCDQTNHYGRWNESAMWIVPGVRVAIPRDAASLRGLLADAVEIDAGPTVIRLPDCPDRR